MNRVAALSQQYGQSVWLDYIRRSLITKGELRRLVEEDGVGGVTSNPAIFEKAISAGDDYTADIEQTSKDSSLDAKAVFERLAVKDIQDAADVLRPVYDRTATISTATSASRWRPTSRATRRARTPKRAVSGRWWTGPTYTSRFRQRPKACRPSGHSCQRRHQRQCDAALRAQRVRSGGAGFYRRS